MFDPHRTHYVNRRIQKKAQIIRSKNNLTFPINAITNKDMQKYAQILAANKIVSYIPGEFAPLPVQLSFIRILDANSTPFLIQLTSFQHVSSTTQVAYETDNIIIVLRNTEPGILSFYAQKFNDSGNFSVPPNSYYYLFNNPSAHNPSILRTYNPQNNLIFDIEFVAGMNPVLDIEFNSNLINILTTN